MSNIGMQAAILILLMVLPLSALLSRRVPLRTTLIYGGIWLGIAALIAIFLQIFT